MQESVYVNVLGGQAAAQHVVGVRHHLDACAAQIAVHHAGGQRQCLAGFEGETIQQQRREDTRVGWEKFVDLHGCAGEDAKFAGRIEMVHGSSQHLVDEVAAVVEAEDIEENLLDGG